MRRWWIEQEYLFVFKSSRGNVRKYNDLIGAYMEGDRGDI